MLGGSFCGIIISDLAAKQMPIDYLTWFITKKKGHKIGHLADDLSSEIGYTELTNLISFLIERIQL
jgi:uncharacterized protein (DUF3820 family)